MRLLAATSLEALFAASIVLNANSQDPVHLVNWTSRGHNLRGNTSWSLYLDYFCQLALVRPHEVFEPRMEDLGPPEPIDPELYKMDYFFRKFYTEKEIEQFDFLKISRWPKWCWYWKDIDFFVKFLKTKFLPEVLNRTGILSTLLEIKSFNLAAAAADDNKNCVKHKQIPNITLEFAEMYAILAKENVKMRTSHTLAEQIEMMMHFAGNFQPEEFVLKPKNMDLCVDGCTNLEFDSRMRNVTAPLYKINIPEFVQLVTTQMGFTIIQTWKWNLQINLRVRMAFSYFRIDEMLGRCLYNLTVTCNNICPNPFTFYGFRAIFTFYPPDNVFALNLHYGRVQYMKIEVFFDILAAQIVSNVFPSANIENSQSLYSYHFHTPSMLLEVTKVKVAPLRSIVFRFLLPEFAHIILYDGPWYKAWCRTISPGTKMMETSGFQAVLNLVSKSKNISKSFNISFAGKLVKATVQSLQQNRQYILLHLSSQIIGKVHAFASVIESPVDTNIEVSLINYQYVGEYHSQCIYSGFSIYDSHNHTELRTVCSNGSSSKLPAYFSDQNHIFLLLYSYKEYSSIEVSVNVSCARCRVVKVHACDVRINANHKRIKIPRSSFFSARTQFVISVHHNICTKVQIVSFPRQGEKLPNVYDFRCKFYFNLSAVHQTSMLAWHYVLKGYLPSSTLFIKGRIRVFQNGSLTTLNTVGRDHPYCNKYGHRHPITKKLHEERVNFSFTSQTPDHGHEPFFHVDLIRSTQNEKEMPWLEVDVHSEAKDYDFAVQHMTLFGKGSLSWISLSRHKAVILTLNGQINVVMETNVTTHPYYTVSPGDTNTAVKLVQFVKLIKRWRKTNTQETVMFALPQLIQNIVLKNWPNVSLGMTFQWVDQRMENLEQVMENRTNGTAEQKLPKWDRSKWDRVTHSIHVANNTFIFIKYRDKYKFDHWECDQKSRTSKTFTWMEASTWCLRIQTQLPQFVRRAEQEQFLYVLKTMNEVFPIEAIFIGLVTKKVGF